jgi:hypothetical protein
MLALYAGSLLHVISALRKMSGHGDTASGWF